MKPLRFNLVKPLCGTLSSDSMRCGGLADDCNDAFALAIEHGEERTQ